MSKRSVAKMVTRKRATRKKEQSNKKLQAEDSANVSIPVVRYLPPDLVTHFADTTLVSHTQFEFAISFLQSQYPLAANKEELEQVEQVVTKCVARIVLTPHHMEELVGTLQRNLERHKETYQNSDNTK